MKANYNVTGEDRKQMVAIISREAGVQVHKDARMCLHD